MTTVAFFLAAGVGFLVTSIALVLVRRRGHAENSLYAAVAGIGFLVTSLASFFVPLVAARVSIVPGLAVLGVVFSTLAGLITYGVTRAILHIVARERRL